MVGFVASVGADIFNRNLSFHFIEGMIGSSWQDNL